MTRGAHGRGPSPPAKQGGRTTVETLGAGSSATCAHTDELNADPPPPWPMLTTNLYYEPTPAKSALRNCVRADIHMLWHGVSIRALRSAYRLPKSKDTPSVQRSHAIADMCARR